MDTHPRQNMQLILGCFNAKIEKEEALRPTIGNHRRHVESNNNGTPLIDFATSLNLRIKSTMFEHKSIQQQTRKSNDRKTWKQIDHILIDTRHASNYLDVRSVRVASAGSDHIWVRAVIRHRVLTLGNKRYSTNQQWNTLIIKNGTTWKQYEKVLEKN